MIAWRCCGDDFASPNACTSGGQATSGSLIFSDSSAPSLEPSFATTPAALSWLTACGLPHAVARRTAPARTADRIVTSVVLLPTGKAVADLQGAGGNRCRRVRRRCRRLHEDRS